MAGWKRVLALGASVVGVLGCSGTGEPQSELTSSMPGSAGEALGTQTRALEMPSTELSSTGASDNDGCLSTILEDSAESIHVATNGNDGNNGSSSAPVFTLQAAHDLIPPGYQKDYRIIVHGGEYRGQVVNWNRASSSHRIRIEAADHETPIFDGRAPGATAGSTLGTFLISKPSGIPNPVQLNLIVKGLHVRYYVGSGFSLGDPPEEATPSNVSQTCTTLVDNTISQIGSVYADCVVATSGTNAGKPVMNRPGCINGTDVTNQCKCIGYGAIDLKYSGKNTLLNNKIINAENLANDSNNRSLIHAVYVAYFSVDNLIENNYVRKVTGYPFKFRDHSADNRAIGNYCERCGGSAFFNTDTSSTNIRLSRNVLTFAYEAGTHANLLSGTSSNFVLLDNQTDEKYYQGGWPTDEQVTASASADVDGDGKEEVFVAFYYPSLNFTKVVYSKGGSTELSEVAYTSAFWRVTALASGKFNNSANANVVAAFWSGGTNSQVQTGLVDTDGVYRFGGTQLLNSSGTSFWKVTAMAGGQVAGTTAPKLFVAVSHDGIQEVHRGDGFSLTSGSSKPGVSDGTALYSSSSWEIPALAVGKVDGSGAVKLVSAFHFIGSGSPLNRLYLGSGSGSGGVTDGGSFFNGSTTLIRALSVGVFDGTNSRLAWGASIGGTGKVFLSGLSGSTIVPQATELYSNSVWDIAAVVRSDTRSGGGDELVTAFSGQSDDGSRREQVWSGNGVSAGTGTQSFDNYYRWP